MLIYDYVLIQTLGERGKKEILPRLLDREIVFFCLQMLLKIRAKFQTITASKKELVWPHLISNTNMFDQFIKDLSFKLLVLSRSGY